MFKWPGKILELIFKILLIVGVFYLIRFLYIWLSWNFTLEDIFSFIVIGFIGWVLLSWTFDSSGSGGKG
ncbi:MAG: hypothetical protein PHC89_01975 [Candidatus Pacebacteria bacterium]|nr:hypothetical protein [Candidatus Paceibacterota bacterium]